MKKELIKPIQIARSKSKVREIIKFRNNIYRYELNKKHLCVTLDNQADHNAIQLYYEAEGILKGGIRFQIFEEGKNDLLNRFPDLNYQGETATVGRLLVTTDKRNSGLGIYIMNACYKLLLYYNVSYLFLEAEDHLIPLYEKMGAKCVQRYKNEVQAHRTLMVLTVFDTDFLAAVGSPLYKAFLKYEVFMGRSVGAREEGE